MLQVAAKVILFLIIPVFIWVVASYLGGALALADLIKRTIALLIAAFVMYLVSTSRF